MSQVLEYLGLYDTASKGGLGPAAQGALCGTLEGLTSQAEKSAEKVDELLDAGEGLDSTSRKRRLAELLKKREATGSATGSASPNPPEGS